jgi:RHS repeat-associated protein
MFMHSVKRTRLADLHSSAKTHGTTALSLLKRMTDMDRSCAVLMLMLMLFVVPTQAAVQMYYLHNDHLGTPRVVTNQQKVVVWKGQLRPFGETKVEVETITNHRRFPGQRFDIESRLYYNYFRDYDPTTGRYLQSDPIGLGGGLNTYAYGKTNPLQYIDSMGLAYFAIRPLQGLPWLGPLSSNPLDNVLNTAISHEQLIFEDGKNPSNIGFFDDGALKEEPMAPNYRALPGSYDDCVMRIAIERVKLSRYRLIGNNCQDWADSVREEYDQLLNDGTARLACQI